jgi:L-ascorbate metabolism protein UlaG (beta-lactamase superfamily)
MVITNYGDGCFRLQSGEASVLIDPEGNRLKADLTIFTSADLKEPPADEPNVIRMPGEYEVDGIEVDGVQALSDSGGDKIKTCYLVRMEDIKVAVLGQISLEPSSDVYERLEEPDIVIIPVDKQNYLSGELALKITKQLEPAIIIPSFLKSEAEVKKAFESKAETQEKFVCKKKDLIASKQELVILESKRGA